MSLTLSPALLARLERSTTPNAEAVYGGLPRPEQAQTNPWNLLSWVSYIVSENNNGESQDNIKPKNNHDGKPGSHHGGNQKKKRRRKRKKKEKSRRTTRQKKSTIPTDKGALSKVFSHYQPSTSTVSSAFTKVSMANMISTDEKVTTTYTFIWTGEPGKGPRSENRNDRKSSKWKVEQANQ